MSPSEELEWRANLTSWSPEDHPDWDAGFCTCPVDGETCPYCVSFSLEVENS